jgi:hypothetical protein
MIGSKRWIAHCTRIHFDKDWTVFFEFKLLCGFDLLRFETHPMYKLITLVLRKQEDIFNKTRRSAHYNYSQRHLDRHLSLWDESALIESALTHIF